MKRRKELKPTQEVDTYTIRYKKRIFTEGGASEICRKLFTSPPFPLFDSKASLININYVALECLHIVSVL